KVVDHRADQFAAAAVFFELLTGQKPFQGRSLAESMLNMERRGPLDVCALNGEVSTALKQVINKALSYECADRYPSAAEFLRAITDAGATVAAPAVAAPPPDETVFAPKSTPADSPLPPPTSGSRASASEIAPSSSTPLVTAPVSDPAE